MIQITLVYDEVDHTFLYAASGDADRANADGWNVDRVNGEGEGWYGLENDGQTFAPAWNIPGANNMPNTLFDEPGGWPNNITFWAVDAAVCFKSSDNCANKILSYYFWSYNVDNNANATASITAPVWFTATYAPEIDREFQSAVAAWNVWAPTSPQQTGNSYVGDTTILQHAAPFPTFADLFTGF